MVDSVTLKLSFPLWRIYSALLNGNLLREPTKSEVHDVSGVTGNFEGRRNE
jgi:hypothetical protein